MRTKRFHVEVGPRTWVSQADTADTADAADAADATA